MPKKEVSSSPQPIPNSREFGIHARYIVHGTFHRCTSFPFPDLLSSSSFFFSPLSASSLSLSFGRGNVDPPLPDAGFTSLINSDAGAPKRLLFNMTISFSQPFSLRSSAASRSSSSTRPERSVIDLSKFSVHCFFFTLNRAVNLNSSVVPPALQMRPHVPDAAVFRRRFSSAITVPSMSVSVPPASGDGVLTGAACCWGDDRAKVGALDAGEENARGGKGEWLCCDDC